VTGRVREAHARSLAQLRENADQRGFLASPVDRLNYRAIWGRDGSICAAAAYSTGDEELIDHARRTLRTLAKHRADNGQVPSYLVVGPDNEITEVNYGGWGQITSIDTSLWFLIACQSAFRQRHEHEFVEDPLFDCYRDVIRYLGAIDANSCGLLEIPLAGDWTDILNRSYHILYDQVLWFRALQGAAELARDGNRPEEAERYGRMATRVRDRLNADFWWDDADTVARVADKYKLRNELPQHPDLHYYQSHLTPFLNDWSHRFDAFANVLAAVMGAAPRARAEAIAALVTARRLDRPFALRVLDPPIRDGDPDAYRLRVADEPPYEYHNGGIWPMAGGFWVLHLWSLGRTEEAWTALANLAEALAAPAANGPPWGFCEYFHGRTFEPKGVRNLSWNGAAYIFAYEAVAADRPPGFVARAPAR
jgi:glycogen debranching enzyme